MRGTANPRFASALAPPASNDGRPLDVESGPWGRLGLAACRASHFSSRAKSLASSSSVRASGSLFRTRFEPAGIDSAIEVTGTGTTRPQSGHLPASGRPAAGTFSRRPQGQ